MSPGKRMSFIQGDLSQRVHLLTTSVRSMVMRLHLSLIG